MQKFELLCLDADEALALEKVFSGWEDLEVSLGESTEEHDQASITAFDAACVLLLVTQSPKFILSIARVVRYIQDNFRRSTVVDFTGSTPRVFTLPAAAGRGKTYIRDARGDVELDPEHGVDEVLNEVAETQKLLAQDQASDEEA